MRKKFINTKKNVSKLKKCPNFGALRYTTINLIHLLLLLATVTLLLLKAALRIRIRDPVPFWPQDPGCGRGKKSRSGSRIRDHISRLETIFWVKDTKNSWIRIRMIFNLWYLWLGCSIVQLVARWPAVRQARVRIPARHRREVFPAERKQWRKRREASVNGDGWVCCTKVIMNVPVRGCGCKRINK